MVRHVVLRVVTAAAVLITLVGPAQAQNRALPGNASLPGPVNPVTIGPQAVAGVLATGYVNSSGWCGGPYINLTAGPNAVAVSGFQMFFKGTGSRTVNVYWKAGSYIGSESNSGAWTLLGSTNVTPGGDGTLTSVAIGGLLIPAGQTYGIKVWDGGTGSSSTGPGLDLREGGTAASDGNLSLSSTRYTCDDPWADLNQNTFGWQGNVLYGAATPVPAMRPWAIAILCAMLTGLVVMALRHRYGPGQLRG